MSILNVNDEASETLGAARLGTRDPFEIIRLRCLFLIALDCGVDTHPTRAVVKNPGDRHPIVSKSFDKGSERSDTEVRAILLESGDVGHLDTQASTDISFEEFSPWKAGAHLQNDRCASW